MLPPPDWDNETPDMHLIGLVCILPISRSHNLWQNYERTIEESNLAHNAHALQMECCWGVDGVLHLKPSAIHNLVRTVAAFMVTHRGTL